MFRTTTIAALLLISTAAAQAQESTTTADPVPYIDAYQAAIDAFRAGDNQGLVNNSRLVLQHVPEQSTALYLYAIGRARQGWLGDAAKSLQTIANQGLSTQLSAIPAFAPLQQESEYSALKQQLIDNRQFDGENTVLLEIELDDFVPEGILALANNQFLLGSIHQSKIMQVQIDGDGDATTQEWVPASQDGLCSVLSIKQSVDAQQIYVATACMEQTAGLNSERDGHSGIFVFDRQGKTIARHWLPEDEDSHVLGDILVWDSQTIITSDSLAGDILKLDLQTGQFQAIGDGIELPNPQGLSRGINGQQIYIADYLAGLFSLDLNKGTLNRLSNPGLAAVHGIDGLIRCNKTLVGIQNGVRPQRIVAFQLDSQGQQITEHRVLAKGLPNWDEPTQGVHFGQQILYVANSHWPQFDANGQIPNGLDGPRLMTLNLDACNT